MEDLISRDALIKAITGIEVKWHIKDGLAGTSYDWTYVKDIILSAPTVEAEPVVHGKWECLRDNKYGLVVGYFCSNCSNSPLYTNWGSKELSFYCPVCGAKMDGKSKV